MTPTYDHAKRALERERRTQNLEQIVAMLSQTSSVRGPLVSDIREQMDEGGYLSEEKLNLAIYRMLKDILG